MSLKRDHIPPRGSKIAELKKIFDSAPANTDTRVLVKRCVVKKNISDAPANPQNDSEGDSGVISDEITSLQKGANSNCSNVNTNLVPDEHPLLSKDKHGEPGSKEELENSVESTGKLNYLNNSGLWNGVDTCNKAACSEIRTLCTNGDSTNENHSYSSANTLTSTLELNNILAATKAELLKKQEVALTIPEKSMLENYFTYAFENNSPKHQTHTESCSPSNKMFSCDDDENAQYECDMEEMFFEDLDDGTISDTSSDDETRCHASPINTHQQIFSLHTIIEESCEESERESQAATPTNQDPTSKLEKYFSWDIVNDVNRDLKRRDSCDESTLYSDSLSEASSSLTGEEHCMEPSPLSSSRLEKYFMSGLVGNESYHYPEDAEFLDDTSVSDFDEEDRHHKISRSALLNSLDLRSAGALLCLEARNPHLETKSSFCETEEETEEVQNVKKTEGKSSSSLSHEFSTNVIITDDDVNQDASKSEESHREINNDEDIAITVKQDTSSIAQDVIFLEDYSLDVNCVPAVTKNSDVTEFENEVPSLKSCTVNDESVVKENSRTDTPSSNPVDDKQQLEPDDPKVVLSKLMSHINDTSANVSESESETSYISAWQLLESEIEQLMSQIPSNSSVENGSRTSSTFGSSNSDYGSDTVDSGECLTTDEDDNCVESKSKNESHISKAAGEESMEMCRKIVESLKKGEFAEYLKQTGGEIDQVHSYIRDCIVSFVKNIGHDKKMSPLLEECGTSDSSNILFLLNSNLENNGCITEDKSLNGEGLYKSDLTTVDEGISVDSTDNLYVDCGGTSNFTEELHLESKRKEEIIVENSDIFDKSSEVTHHHQADDQSMMIFSSNMGIFCSESELELGQQVQCSTESVAPCESNREFLLLNSGEPQSDESANVPEVNHPANKDISLKSLDGSQSSIDDSTSQFSVYVDIQINEEETSVKERTPSNAIIQESPNEPSIKRSSLHLWVSQEPTEVPAVNERIFEERTDDLSDMQSLKRSNSVCDSQNITTNISSDSIDFTSTYPKVSQRDTGYYSFKSSEDSMLYSVEPESEVMECTDTLKTDFESLESSSRRCSIKSSTSEMVLSQSTTNIPESFDMDMDVKFSTLQTKSRALKVSMNPRTAAPDSRASTYIFSPSAVIKKFKSNKGNSSETTYPSKYLKKYGRSSSVDGDSMYGATSMPHLGFAADSYSMSGGIDCDRESSLTDDELDGKYSGYNQSILSLGAHSASTTSVYSAAGGRHFGYISVSGDVLFGLNYNQKSQMMEVFIKQCRNLAAMDSRKNKSDPYVKVYLLPDKSKSGKRKTKVKKNTLNPVFNELLRFPVLKHELESRTLWLSVWNSDLFGRNDFLGEVTLNLGYRLLDSPTLRWYPLQERTESLTSPLTYKGELFLALKYVPKDLSLESRFRPAPVISLKGALHVLIKEARNLTLGKSTGAFDSFCKSYLLPDKSKSSKQKTPVLKKSRHPKWYYTMIYEDLSVEELKDRSLELTLWDHDKLTSNEFMGGVRLNNGIGLYHGVPVEWMDSTRDEALLWQSMLERPNMWVDGCLPLRPTMQSLRS